MSKLSPVETLTPLEQEQQTEQKIEQQTEELSKEVDEIAKSTNKKSKKIKKEKTAKVKEEKPKKVKRDPYDTKGFIFLHDKQPDMNNYTDTNVQDVKNTVKEEKPKKQKKAEKKLKEVTKEIEKIDNAEIINPQPQPKTTNFHGVELLPLDEIKAPDLKPNGYSIFAR